MLRGFLISSVFLAGSLVSSWGAQAQQRGSAQTPPAAPKDPPKAPAARPAPATPPRTQSRRTATRRRAAPSRTQQQPSRERYAEIQKALAGLGYDPGPTDGVWGSKSVAALQAYQRDQGLEPTGKIDSLSLIRLGLGPKHDTQPQARVTDPGPP
ncbi:MAG: peptidoglycan-binding domain-containing protein [Terriglobia bacterium]